MVKKLSFENFQKARGYLMNYGRELEQELFKFHFENSSLEDVINKLQEYQGDNGGFRNMGEGDPFLENAMDTSMVFQHLSEIGAPSSEEIVQKGIKYITNSYDHKIKGWQPRLNNNVDHWVDNPSAELLGYLYEYQELVPTDLLQLITHNAIPSISTIHNTEEPQFYFLTALCIYRLAVRIDEPYKSELLTQLKKEIHEIIETDPYKWSATYCAKPFFFANSPHCPLYLTIKEFVIQSLENEICTQSEDGHFILNWAADEEASLIWKSIWTMDVLRALNFHDMIEKST